MSKFICIKENENMEGLEIPVNQDNCINLSTISAQYTGVTGLKYKSETGNFRAVELNDENLLEPDGGWENKNYIIVKPGYYLLIIIEFTNIIYYTFLIIYNL